MVRLKYESTVSTAVSAPDSPGATPNRVTSADIEGCFFELAPLDAVVTPGCVERSDRTRIRFCVDPWCRFISLTYTLRYP